MNRVIPVLILMFATSAFAQVQTPGNGPFSTPVATPAPSPTATFTPTPAPVVLNVIMFEPQNPSVAKGSTVQLAGVGIYSDGSMRPISNVTWASSATNIASISATGLVTGVAAGQTTITATVNGNSAKTTVTVTSNGTAK